MHQLDRPLVTLITPCRNAAGSIGDTLRSVAVAAAQLERAGLQLEQLVIDGHSTDGTAELVSTHIRRYPWCRWLAGHGGGPYAGMAVGLAEARGHYVHVLNADDYLLQPQRYSQVLQQAYEQRAAFVLASITYVKRPQLRPGALWRVRPLPTQSDAWHRLLRAGLHYPHPGFVAERYRYVEQGFDLRYRYAADYKLMQTLLLAARPEHVLLEPEALVAMARGGSTGTWAGRRAGAAELRAINQELGITQPLWRRYAGKALRRVQARSWLYSAESNS